LEKFMATDEYLSDFARRYVDQGEAKGRADGEIRALLAVLNAREIPVSDDIRAHITGPTGGRKR
jgi:hypothetical protein